LALIALLFLFFRYQWLAHAIFMACGFALVMNLWTTTLVRIRGRSLAETTYWTRVFRTLPLNKFSGIFIIGSIIVTTFIFLYNGIRFLHYAFTFVYTVDEFLYLKLGEFFTGLFVPVFITALIAILCRDILRLTEAKEMEVLDRLRAEQVRTELITNVTHDIRTPLTSIINYVDLMQKLDVENEEMTEYIGVLNKKAGRLKNLVNDLLDASKAGSGYVKIDIEKINLIELIGQVAGDFDEAMRAANLEYVNPHSDKHILIAADGGQLWRVLENLYANAVKYAMPGSRIYVNVCEGEQDVVFSLKNISRDKLQITPKESTQQFIRGEQSRQTEGSGLGLYIAERLTVLMGGRFEIAIDGDQFEVRITFPN
jgi:signal transduction histidine kinase